ncbi:hypothetical protein SAMD00023353_0501630 [Rosellinia necatrix]|uniref:Uncharacterized protein n=1 Tax=Rosellinia necatrix TaxID=77044 RepID=A0A1S7UKH5_ROSNE|nr:hypothetical protein SAMD00023353_0501630 [Rosellinia necatrix]
MIASVGLCYFAYAYGERKTSGRYPPLDFNLPRFIPPSDAPNALSGPERPHDVNWRQAFTECSPSDIEIFDTTYVDPVLSEPLPARGITGTLDPSSPSPSQPINAWCRGLATPLSLEVAGSDDANVEFTSLRSQKDGDNQAVAIAHNYLGDVLELERQLAEDHESLRTADVYPPYADKSPNPIESAVQCAINRSSHLCELLRNIIDEDRSIASASSSLPYNPILGRRGRAGNANCAVLTTSAVTAYILLVRNWRRIFICLYRLLLVGQPLLGGMVSSDIVIMPSLQLWGSRVQSSPATQVAVLIELSFDLLEQIETRLGAGCWGISRTRKGSGACVNHACDNRPGHAHLQAGCVLQGPVAISIRDMLLSQEMVRLAEGADELDTLPLGELAAQLKSRLQDRA